MRGLFFIIGSSLLGLSSPKIKHHGIKQNIWVFPWHIIEGANTNRAWRSLSCSLSFLFSLLSLFANPFLSSSFVNSFTVFEFKEHI